MGVEPKKRGKPPKWMVKIMETPIKMDDLGIPVFLETPIFSMGFFLLLYRSGKQLSWLAVALAMRLRKDTATLVTTKSEENQSTTT